MWEGEESGSFSAKVEPYDRDIDGERNLGAGQFSLLNSNSLLILPVIFSSFFLDLNRDQLLTNYKEQWQGQTAQLELASLLVLI